MINLSLFDEKLSNGQGSLLKDKERNCISLIIKFGEKIEYKFCKTIIKNRYNISYENADKLMKKKSDFKNFITLLSKYWGNINDSHILIEKMMIFYNSKMADFLKSKNLNFPIRIHQGINKDIFEKYKQVTSLSLSTDDLLKKICYHSAEYINSQNCENPFHYGLDVSLYTHATSPLRRVSDYIIQKIFSHNVTYDINKICNILNEKMNKIKKAYRNIAKIKLIQELKLSKYRNYSAIVINFNPSQIIVYIPELDIIHPINIFSKISEIISISIEDVIIHITHKNTNNKISLKLLDNVEIKIMITPYEFNMNKKIRLYLVKPNLIKLID